MQGKEKSSYVPSLDGLRAICALAVVGYHMNLSWSSGGFHGVTVLLVLSGYLITSGLLGEYFGRGHGHIDFIGFWKKRLWRLMPVVIAFILATTAACVAFNHLLLTKMRPDVLPASFMVINWTKIFSQESYFAAAGAPSPLTHFWSLAIEAQFYLLWPLLLAFILSFRPRKKTISYILLGASLVSALEMAILYVPGQDPTRVYYGLDTRAFNLLMGAWLAVVWPFKKMSLRSIDDFGPERRTQVRVVGWACVLGLLAMMVFSEGYSGFSYRGGIAIVTVLSVGAIAALTPSGTPLHRLLGSKPLGWIGKRSYSIYIWHYPILELLNPRNATLPTPWWALLLELALILVVSDLSYRFVERPFRNGWPLSDGLKGLLDWQKSHVPVTACVSVVLVVGGRQAGAALEAYEAYRDQGVVGDTVIFSIGSNGILDADVMGQICDAVGSDKQLYFVNIRVPDDRCAPNNKVIQECVDAHDNVHLIDWYEATKGHDDYLIEDGIHLEYEGRAPFAQLIVDTIGYEPPTDANTAYSTVLIGDQICQDASGDLAAAFPLGLVDSAQGRKASDVHQVFANYRDQGVVGTQAIFVVGNDEALTGDALDDILDKVGDSTGVWFVNTRTPARYCTGNNELLSRFAESHDNVKVIDWYAASAGHDAYFTEDGMHLTAEGSKAFTDCVVSGMGDAYKNTLQDQGASEGATSSR